MDRCHGVNTGAGHVSKGKSPVAQLSEKAFSEHHQGQDLKQRLIRKKRESLKAELFSECKTGVLLFLRGLVA